jgi:hypothetical protein
MEITEDKYELVYPSGGHCGPFSSYTSAILQAKQRIRPEGRMDIVNRHTGVAYTMKLVDDNNEFVIHKSKRRYRSPFP